VKGQLQKAQQKAPNEGAYDSYDQIDDQTDSSSFHDSFGQKTSYKSYYQESDQGLNLHTYSHVLLLPHYSVLLDEQNTVNSYIKSSSAPAFVPRRTLGFSHATRSQ
jgi:hypothetical protein